MTETPVLDNTAVERLQRIGGAELASQMIELFLQHGAQRVSDAADAAAAGDHNAVERAAHGLKSSAGNVGARRLQLAAEEAEHAAEQGDVASLTKLTATLQDEYRAAAAALTTLLAELK